MDRDRLTESPEETIAFGKQLARDFPGPTVFCLFGELGAGKTTLIQGIALQATENSHILVNSPTFVYLNIYPGKMAVYHFDLYRLNGERDFLNMGFDEYFGEGIVCIEWSERIQGILPEERIELYLDYVDPKRRRITVKRP